MSNEINDQPAVCKCGHPLSSHPPRADKVFAWPCRACDCEEYDEVETS